MSDFLIDLSNVVYDFTTDYNGFLYCGLLAALVILLVLYLIRFRVATVRREAFWLRRANAALRAGSAVDFSDAPKRIACASSIRIEAITGRGKDAPRHSAYGLGGVVVCALATGVGLFSGIGRLYILSLPFWLLLYFVLFTGRKAYFSLDEECEVYRKLTAPSLTDTVRRIAELLDGMPDMSQAVYTTKELTAAIAHAQATADANALETLVDRYCATMNESMNGQLARMGEVMQSTIDAQNELRKALRLLLNDLAAASADLRRR
ncbi:MAG: hypothetical protein KIG36_04975 [Eubacteriales bacterium]|nr:hypothetical protein [Eubacteriales bacterium]